MNYFFYVDGDFELSVLRWLFIFLTGVARSFAAWKPLFFGSSFFVTVVALCSICCDWFIIDVCAEVLCFDTEFKTSSRQNLNCKKLGQLVDLKLAVDERI